MSSDAFPRQQGEETEEWVSQEVKIEAKKDRFGEPQPSVTRLSFLSSWVSQEVKIEAKKDRFREPQPVVAWWFVSESIAVT